METTPKISKCECNYRKQPIQARGEREWKSKEAKTTQRGQSTAKDSQVKESLRGRGGYTKGEHNGSAFELKFKMMACY